MVRSRFRGMMEIFYRRSRFIWLQLMLFMIICISRVSPATSQNGFLSIDCGSDQPYYDNTTGIFWEPDANYISTGKNFNGITVKKDHYNDPLLNKNQLGSLRYFEGPHTRDCYVLPTTPQHIYLIRATFYFGNWQNGSITNTFGVYLNGTNWLSFDYLYSEDYNPDNAYFDEAIVYSPGNILNLCLVREKGSSFISTLELRELASGMYSEAVGPPNNVATFLSMQIRFDCGPSISDPAFVRFPDDAYDRIWSNPSTSHFSDNSTHISNSTKLSSSFNATATPDRPPVKVMETAWAYYETNTLYLDEVYTGPIPYPVYVTAYFQELDGNASATKVRGMNYYLNDNYMTSFNTSYEPLEIHGPKAVDFLNDDFINITFVQESWSKLVPVLNAVEIYFSIPFNSSETAIEDVTALSTLQKEFNLLDWTGDPCVPVPFDFVSCTADTADPTVLRITNLSVTNMNIAGPIPQGILDLTALTALSLNNNDFSGSIPDNFSSLVHLQTLNLENNKLSGIIPSFLGALPHLTQLHLDNNNFTGTIPPDLANDTRLNFTALNNQISNCTIRACGFIPVAPASQPSSLGKGSSGGSNTGAVVGGILGALAALAVISWIVWFLCTRKRRARSSIIRALGQAENQRECSVIRKAMAGSTISLSLQEVSDATKRFQKKIGEGSFGPVYYGKLPNGHEVAVKVKATDSRQGFHEFLNEVDLLSRIHHRNLVSLAGFCEEADQQMLVYVYVPNGTFRDHLYGDKTRTTLNWRTRVDIALNSARGLEYLHTDCNPRIIHRDVKTSNILLDENMVAKVADFGISKQAPEGLFSGMDTLLKGTMGYFDPEYFITQRLTQKSDVYSFGVVLLEMISGRHPHVSDLPDGTTGTLIQWVQNSVRDGTPMDIVDPKLRGEFNEDSVMKVLFLALRSTNMVTTKRPDMGQVARTLAEAIELELLAEVTPKADHMHETQAAIPEGKDEGRDVPAVYARSLPGSDISNPNPRGSFELSAVA